MVERADSEDCAATKEVEVRDSPMRIGASARLSIVEIAVETAPPSIGPAPTLPPKNAWSNADPVTPAAVDAISLVIENYTNILT